MIFINLLFQKSGAASDINRTEHARYHRYDMSSSILLDRDQGALCPSFVEYAIPRKLPRRGEEWGAQSARIYCVHGGRQTKLFETVRLGPVDYILVSRRN